MKWEERKSRSRGKQEDSSQGEIFQNGKEHFKNMPANCLEIIDIPTENCQ